MAVIDGHTVQLISWDNVTYKAVVRFDKWIDKSISIDNTLTDEQEVIEAIKAATKALFEESVSKKEEQTSKPLLTEYLGTTL